MKTLKKMMMKMEDGFKNEENARQLVQKELAVMKDELKNIKDGQRQYSVHLALVRLRGRLPFLRDGMMSSS